MRYNSQKSEEQWSILILDTLNAVQLFQTATTIDCSLDTAFHMRLKFMILLEQLIFNQPLLIDRFIKMDETFINDGFKGNKHLSSRKFLNKGETAHKRGLFEEKLYIFIGTNSLCQQSLE